LFHITDFHSYRKDASQAVCLVTVVLVVSLPSSFDFLWAGEPNNPATPLEQSAGESQGRLAGLDPPIRIGDTSAAGDGGTIFIELIGNNDRRLTLSVSQDAWEGSDIPHNTLFLDVPHPLHAEDEREGRLPVDNDEVVEVLRLLRLAAESEKDNGKSGYPETALERLEGKANHSVRDPTKGIEPEWYPAYAAKKQQDREATLAGNAREALFLGCFPKNARLLLDVPQEIHFDPDADVDKEVRKRSEQLLAMFENQSDFILRVFRAFGIKSDDNRISLDYTDLVLIGAVQDTEVDFLIEALSEMEDDEATMLGAARVLFDPNIDYVKRLSAYEWDMWVPRLAGTVLSKGADKYKSYVVDAVSQNQGAAATLLLRDIANGVYGYEEAITDKDRVMPFRISAYLALAQRNDQSVKISIENQLEKSTQSIERAALEVCLALLGEPKYLKESHFKLRSPRIERSALRAIELYRGRHGMDLLMSPVVLDRSSHIQREAVVLAQKLTGQQWLPSRATQETGTYSTDASNWWKENRETFMRQFAAEGE